LDLTRPRAIVNPLRLSRAFYFRTPEDDVNNWHHYSVVEKRERIASWSGLHSAFVGLDDVKSEQPSVESDAEGASLIERPSAAGDNVTRNCIIVRTHSELIRERVSLCT